MGWVDPTMAATPLDQLRAHLDHFDPEDRHDILRFLRLATAAGEDMVDELAPRLLKSLTPRPMRALIMELAFYHPHREWLDSLVKALRHEADLETFRVGCQALARQAPKDALGALRELFGLRHAEAFQEVVSEALALADPAEAVAYHYGRLMEGSANTRVSNEAALQLARLVGPADVDRLVAGVHHEDLLIARHALKLVAGIPDRRAMAFLLEHLQESHEVSLGDRVLKDALAAVKGQGSDLRAELKGHLQSVLGEAGGESLQAVLSEGEGMSPALATALQTLKVTFRNPCEAFLIEAMQLVAEGKPAKQLQLAQEAAEAYHQRGRRLAHAVDTCAEGLGALVAAEVADRDEVLPSLVVAYRAVTGREGVGRVLGTLVQAEDRNLQEVILSGPDTASRAAALEAVGQRRDEDLLPFLLRACQDPIVDLAQRCMLGLGRLAGAQGATLKLLSSEQLDEVRMGLRIAGINRMAGAADAIQARIAHEEREDLVLEAVEALGAIRASESASFLMERLHSGQSPRLQAALAQALASMGDPQTALDLAGRARELRSPALSAIAVEGFVWAHGLEGPELPAASVSVFREALLQCWNDKEPWAWRQRLFHHFTRLHAPAPFLEELAQLLQAFLADKKLHPQWTPDEMASAQGTVKDLLRRAEQQRS